MSTTYEKSQFTRTFERELATTLRVLRAFPADKGTYTPHENSSNAARLAWTFVIENEMAMQALKGPLKFGSGMPKAPATMGEIISAYETSARAYLKELAATPESRLDESIQFPSGPGKMGDMRVMD